MTLAARVLELERIVADSFSKSMDFQAQDAHGELMEIRERQVRALTEALEWYADDKNYALTLRDAASGRDSRVVDDDGHRARAALALVRGDEQQ